MFIESLPSRSAAKAVVPAPENGSKIRHGTGGLALHLQVGRHPKVSLDFPPALDTLTDDTQDGVIFSALPIVIPGLTSRA